MRRRRLVCDVAGRILFLRDIPASTQCRATIGPPAKRHFNGASLEGHWRPTLRGLPVFPIDVSHSFPLSRYT